MHKVYDSIATMIGKTPMFEFVGVRKKLSLKANVFGKCEFYNPLFSAEDRTALKMIEEAMKTKADKDTIFVAAVNENLGLSIAAIGAAMEIKILEVMPENINPTKIQMIKYFGADVIQTPAEDGMKGASAKAEILAEKSDKVFLLTQLENDARVKANLFNTSTEILADMGGDVDALVAIVKTGEALKGIAQALKTSNPDLHIVAVVLDEGNNLGKDLEMNWEVVRVDVSDAADMAKAVAQTEGVPIGILSGAVMVAAVDMAAQDKFKNKNIVAILPDKRDECCL